jgi:hypothetical protein
MMVALLINIPTRDVERTDESSDNIAPPSAKTNRIGDIRQLVNDILKRREPGISPVHVGGTDPDDMFYRGLVNYQAGTALSWLTAEWELAAVKSITAEGTFYNTIAERVLGQIKPVLDRYAPYLNSSD